MERTDKQYVKRTQKDYSYAFQVVSEVECGELTMAQAQRKYGKTSSA